MGRVSHEPSAPFSPFSPLGVTGFVTATAGIVVTSAAAATATSRPGATTTGTFAVTADPTLTTETVAASDSTPGNDTTPLRSSAASSTTVAQFQDTTASDASTSAPQVTTGAGTERVTTAATAALTMGVTLATDPYSSSTASSGYQTSLFLDTTAATNSTTSSSSSNNNNNGGGGGGDDEPTLSISAWLREADGQQSIIIFGLCVIGSVIVFFLIFFYAGCPAAMVFNQVMRWLLPSDMMISAYRLSFAALGGKVFFSDLKISTPHGAVLIKATVVRVQWWSRNVIDARAKPRRRRRHRTRQCCGRVMEAKRATTVPFSVTIKCQIVEVVRASLVAHGQDNMACIIDILLIILLVRGLKSDEDWGNHPPTERRSALYFGTTRCSSTE